MVTIRPLRRNILWTVERAEPMNTATTSETNRHGPALGPKAGRNTRRKTAMRADVRRAIVHGWKRFLSILVISALGVTIFLGLTALAEDVAKSADQYYRQQGLYDLSVTAAGGLDQRDVDRLGEVEGVGAITGGLEQNLDVTVAGSRKHLTVSVLNPHGINRPYRVSGVMPDSSGQVAVNESYLKDSGKKLGDAVRLSDITTQPAAGQGPMLFKDQTYTIVAQVSDAKNIYNPDFATGSTSTQADYSFFVPKSAAVKEDMYSSAYLRLSAESGLSSYGKDYRDHLSQTRKAIERTDGPEGRSGTQTTRTSSETDPKWIVSDRSVLQSYNQIDTQVSFLKLFGITFPLLFLLVAVLISLTSMTRMVEEDRQLIGTYKALGYRKREILVKYLAFAGISALVGSLLGLLLGFVGIPSLAFPLLKQMYVIPSYSLSANWLLAAVGMAIFLVTIEGAAWGTCFRELGEGPAALMRPQAPKAGGRILLQRVGFIWSHFSFLNKVTARNLFRYKTRAFMSIFGVLGCSALMMVSFTLKDTMLSLPERQYGSTYTYDAMAITSPTLGQKATKELAGNGDVIKVKPIMVTTMTLRAQDSSKSDSSTNDGGADLTQVSLQLIVIPDWQSLDGYIRLEETRKGKSPLTLPDSGALLTVNAAKLLNLQPGSTGWAEDDLHQGHSVTIADITNNYTGNSLYMTQSAYESTFDTPGSGDGRGSDGQPFKTNAFLLKLKGDDQKKIATAKDLEQDETFLSVVSNQKLKEDFATNYATINDVVGLLIIMAALLAFVVLFTLSTTNISERERELATIKVLGFRRGEVHSYVNKETLILTLLGIALGLPIGWGLTYPMVGMMKMPGIHLEVQTSPLSWLIVAVLALVFALAVMLITNRSLDQIDMVESLKSTE